MLTDLTARIIELKDQKTETGAGLTWRQIAEQVGLSRSQVRDRYRNAQGATDTPEPRPRRAPATPATPATPAAMPASAEPPDSPLDGDHTAIAHFLDKRTTTAPNWRDLVATATAVQNANADTEDTQRTAEVTVTTNEPIYVIFSGDWHLGNLATDYATWRAHIEMILGRKQVYLIALGDVTENMRSFKSLSAVLNQALTPRLQGYLLRSVVDELTSANKLLAWVRGNHDEFDEHCFGDVLQRYLLENMRAPTFSNRGLVKLRVGNESAGWATYTMLLFHKSRFRSFMRGTHGAYREMQQSYPANIVAGAHDHAYAIEVFDNFTLAADSAAGFGGRTFLIKTGTFQDGLYGWRYFHNGGKPTTPTVKLWPGQHKMALVLDPLEDAT